MIELKGLEDWAREILARPISRLNRQFGSWKKQDEIRQIIENLPFFNSYRPIFRTVSAPILRELHQKLRGQKCETNFWVVLLGILDYPLPDEVAFDLIEREIAVTWLGHSCQSEAVTRRLALLVSEALLALTWRFYTGSNYSLEEFEEILSRSPGAQWLLASLSHASASSLEKRRVFEKAIENHPDRDVWLDTNPKIDSNQNQNSFSHYDLKRYEPEEWFGKLYGSYNAQKILEFARDDQTPDEILRELEESKGFASAKEVRIAARANLRRREENGESHI